jgi:hypothetical protein
MILTAISVCAITGMLAWVWWCENRVHTVNTPHPNAPYVRIVPDSADFTHAIRDAQAALRGMGSASGKAATAISGFQVMDYDTYNEYVAAEDAKAQARLEETITAAREHARRIDPLGSGWCAADNLDTDEKDR